MTIKSFLPVLLFSINMQARAQKALPIKIDSLLLQIPRVHSCAASFALATIATAQDGTVSVKDAGPVLNGITDQLTKNMMALAHVSMGASYGGNQVPSQDQINQAMQNASGMQGMNREQMMQMARTRQSPSVPATPSRASMAEYGKAQDASARLSVLQGELATSASQLAVQYQQKMDALPSARVTCEDFKVQGADLATPKCGCVKSIYEDYHRKRIDIEDQYLQKLAGLLDTYLPQFRQQIGIIDKAEADLRYGDAISIPALKSQLIGLQQRAMGSLTTVLGVVGNAVKPSATEHADWLNIDMGHLPVPCQ